MSARTPQHAASHPTRSSAVAPAPAAPAHVPEGLGPDLAPEPAGLGGLPRASKERLHAAGPGEESIEVASLLFAAGDPEVPAQPAGARLRRVHWRQVLAGSSPREVLARLLQGDPLELQPRVAAALRARALLLDADRALLRTMARCARMAQRYRGHPELERWLDERVDEALLDLVREDGEGAGDATGDNGALSSLSRPLGLEPAAMAAACASFNLLPLAERRAFHDLLIESRSLDELAAGGASASEIARQARRALEVLLVGARGEELGEVKP